MKWFPCCARRRPPLDTGGSKARKRAEVELRRVKVETQEYAELAADLREIRRRNHLAETFLRATNGGSR
jgi:hypothetical protein